MLRLPNIAHFVREQWNSPPPDILSCAVLLRLWINTIKTENLMPLIFAPLASNSTHWNNYAHTHTHALSPKANNCLSAEYDLYSHKFKKTVNCTLENQPDRLSQFYTNDIDNHSRSIQSNLNRRLIPYDFFKEKFPAVCAKMHWGVHNCYWKNSCSKIRW